MSGRSTGTSVLMVIVAVVFVAVVTTPASADPAKSMNAVASGAFTGTTSNSFNTDGCGFSSPIHQVFDASLSPEAHPAKSFHLDGCVEVVANPIRYSGSFTVEVNGGSLSGTVTGTIGGATACLPLDFVLTVTGGTGRLSRASGTIALQGSWCSRAVPAVDDPISGDLVASLVRL